MTARGPHYQKGLPFALDAAPPVARLSEPAEAEVLYLLGLATSRSGVARDLAEARRLHQKAARAGIVEAQFELSLFLSQGIGGKPDRRGAARWERKAAEAGHPRACLNRASRLASGKNPDYAEAAFWYERAADAGNAEAAARLCRMHLQGQGVPRDERIARRWYERAAALGYSWKDV